MLTPPPSFHTYRSNEQKLSVDEVSDLVFGKSFTKSQRAEAWDHNCAREFLQKVREVTLYRYTEHRDNAWRRLLEAGSPGRLLVVSARISWDETEQVLFHRRDLRPMAAEGVSDSCSKY